MSATTGAGDAPPMTTTTNPSLSSSLAVPQRPQRSNSGPNPAQRTDAASAGSDADEDDDEACSLVTTTLFRPKTTETHTGEKPTASHHNSPKVVVRKRLEPSRVTKRPPLGAPALSITPASGGAPSPLAISSSARRSSYDGKVAGLYDLELTLGRGHFAVVKLARHVFTGEKVAVKVIDKAKLDDVSRAHLFQEVRCMKLVQHPNVVRLYEVIDTQTKLYLVLELGDGGDMYDYIMKHEKGLDEMLARRYFSQIVAAISYCHQLHVVHRDLKPENVLFFEKAGVVKLTDFGFSNRFCPGQKLETSCGSLGYSAPEILLGDSYDAPAVDVWSLGVILYMLVCGHPPFQQANDSETLTMIMDCKYTIPPHVSSECRGLISRMLIRDPEKRATLEQIGRDPWVYDATDDDTVDRCGGASDLLPLVSREHLTEEDHAHIIQKMVNGNIGTKEEILEALDRNDYNHITATYFLLAERRLRAQRLEQLQAGSSDAQQRKTSAGSIRSIPEEVVNGGGRESGDATSVSSAGSQTQSNGKPPVTAAVPASLAAQQAAAAFRNRKFSIVEEEDEDNTSGASSLSLGRRDSSGMLISVSRLSRKDSMSKLKALQPLRDSNERLPPVGGGGSRNSSSGDLSITARDLMSACNTRSSSIDEGDENAIPPAPFPTTSRLGLNRQPSRLSGSPTSPPRMSPAASTESLLPSLLSPIRVAGYRQMRSPSQTPSPTSPPSLTGPGFFSPHVSTPSSPSPPCSPKVTTFQHGGCVVGFRPSSGGSSGGQSASSPAGGGGSSSQRIPNRKLHTVHSSPQLTLNEIREEGESHTGERPLTSPVEEEEDNVSNAGSTGGGGGVRPVTIGKPIRPAIISRRYEHNQKRRPKHRSASCSSSDASDDDSESRRIKARIKSLQKRDSTSHDDSSDSQADLGGGGPPSAGGMGGGVGGGEGEGGNDDGDRGDRNGGHGDTDNATGPGGGRGSSGRAGGGGGGAGTVRRHSLHPFRNKICETRLRSSKSLSRICELQILETTTPESGSFDALDMSGSVGKENSPQLQTAKDCDQGGKAGGSGSGGHKFGFGFMGTLFGRGRGDKRYTDKVMAQSSSKEDLKRTKTWNNTTEFGGCRSPSSTDAAGGDSGGASAFPMLSPTTPSAPPARQKMSNGKRQNSGGKSKHVGELTSVDDSNIEPGLGSPTDCGGSGGQRSKSKLSKYLSPHFGFSLSFLKGRLYKAKSWGTLNKEKSGVTSAIVPIDCSSETAIDTLPCSEGATSPNSPISILPVDRYMPERNSNGNGGFCDVSVPGDGAAAAGGAGAIGGVRLVDINQNKGEKAEKNGGPVSSSSSFVVGVGPSPVVGGGAAAERRRRCGSRPCSSEESC